MSSMIEDLQRAASLPDDTQDVVLVQTHISLVFLADQFVYKIKKPVNFGFLDFSTLEKRRYYCHQEVKLNRRLTRDIYLKVLPVLFDSRSYSLGPGEGEIVEYAVKMKRIPEERLMKWVFLRGELTQEEVETLAQVLAEFHLTASRSPEIDQFGNPESFKVNTDENFAQVDKYIGTAITEREFSALQKWTEDFFESNRELFFQRIREGRIRDCHGDLHMEHVCLIEGLPIVDCIEFNDRFRYSDSIADMAFILMDLEYHGGEIFSSNLWEGYKELASEKGGGVDALLIFYKVYRAFVRGKVNSFQLDDEEIGPGKKEEAVQTAKKYFQLAHSYIE